MKLIKFEKKDDIIEKKLNKRKVIFSIIILLIIIILVVLSGIYITNAEFRNIIDTHIFRKNITEDNAKLIQIQTEKSPHFYAFDKYVVKLEDNTLTKYISSGREEEKIKMEINNPIFTSGGKNLIVAEKDKQKIYSISDKGLLWEKELEGNISRISINKNGYSSVILTGTTYKSVIVVMDREGKELFRIYLASTIAVDSTISDDNKFLSFAEINTSGTIIQSNIKTVSIEKAIQKKEDSYVFTHIGNDDSIVVNIKYQDKNTLTVLYNDRIDIIKNDKITTLKKLDNKDEKVTFSDIELDSNIFRVLEKNKTFFNSNSTVEIKNTLNNKENIYLIDGISKNVFSNENVSAINLGTEVHFISANSGWLIKKYNSKKDIKKIVLTDKIAGIIYHDKIELIDL